MATRPSDRTRAPVTSSLPVCASLVPRTLVDGLADVPSVWVLDGLTDGECVVVVDGLTDGDGEVELGDGVGECVCVWLGEELGDGECEWVWLGDALALVV